MPIRNKQPDDDAGRKIVDEQLSDLEARLTSMYETAAKEMKSDLDKFMSKYEAKDEENKAKVASGEMSQKEYQNWKDRQIFRSDAMKAKIEDLTTRAVNADKQAMAMVNDQLPETYATSYNFGGFRGETYANAAGFDYTQFTIINQEAVKELMTKDPDLIPWKTDPDLAEDKKWNRQHIQEAVRQGIVKGDSMDKIADRLLPVVNMDKNAAIRTARTAVNGIENKGRKDATERVKEAGIPMDEMWSSTHDGRTRDTHILLDKTYPNDQGLFGEGIIPTGNLLEYPGDPSGDPEEIYNCRCGLLSFIKGIDHSKDDELYAQMMEEEYYDNWLKVKEDMQKKEEAFQANKKGAAERVEARRERLEEQKAEENNNVTETSKYQNAEELEKAIMEDGGKLDDDRLLAYSNTLEEEMAYNASLKNNLEQAINENGYTEGIKTAIEAEEKEVKQALENMPEMKTPEQIAQEEALNERLDILSSLKQEESTEEIQELEENINVSESKIDEDKSLLTSEEKQEILEIPDEARKEIDRFEKKNMDKKNEYSMVVDANGNIIGEAGGKKTSTHLTEGENLASEGNYHIHNHPLGDVIYSDQDIRNYEYYGVRGGLVITKDGTEYELINMDPVSKVKEAEELKHEFLYGDMTEKEYNEKMNELLPFSSEVSSNFDRIETEWRDERREKLDQLYGQYGRENREMVNKMYDQWKESVGDDNARKAKWLEDNAEKYGFVFGKRKVK